MEEYIIYMHKNKINNKVYIGQTKCKDPNKRWRNGTHYKNTYFGNAIKKYGWNNFEHIILESGIKSLDEANQKEQYYIKKYNSNQSQYGYNLTSGGNNFKLNEEMRKQRSEEMKKRWENEETRAQLIAHNRNFWKTHSDLKAEWGQTVKCIETGDIFQSYREAGEWCGLKFYKNSFLMYFRGERQSCGKHPKTKIPLHWIKLDKQNKEIEGKQNFDIKKSERGKRKKVECIETKKIFNSLAEAAKYYNLASSSGITNAIRGIKKSAGKHPETGIPLHWKYLEEEDK